MAERQKAIYPPERHMLRDLRVGFEAGPGRPVVAPITPEILHRGGSARVGVLGVFIDVMGGGAAIQAAGEDWAVTSDLAIHVTRPIGEGVVIGRSRTLRAGKNGIVLEIELESRESGEIVASSTLGFRRIQRRTPAPAVALDDALPFEFAGPEHGLKVPLFEALGIRVVDAAVGRVEVPLRDYVRNSVGAMQGGGVLCVAEAAAEAWASVNFPADTAIVTSDLVAYYLAMVKIGPIASRTRVLRRAPDAAVVRIELLDGGDEDRLLTVVTATLGPPLEG